MVSQCEMIGNVNNHAWSERENHTLRENLSIPLNSQLYNIDTSTKEIPQ